MSWQQRAYEHVRRTNEEDAARYDAFILRSAAGVLRRRSKKPNGFFLGVFCKILTDTADKLERR